MSTRKPPSLGRTGASGWAQGTSGSVSRRRSDSQSQVVGTPLFLCGETRTNASPSKPKKPPHILGPQKRHQAEFYVTLALLNDTFATKYIHVPYYPETCKLGRPTGTKIKPHITNGYFDSRVLSRNHACMFVDARTGHLMVQDMGLSNGTFVNMKKLLGEPVAVSVGDTVNLGFNIQVETNHKQISAKIENINVVSNNPKGALHDMFPRLTKLVMANFCEHDMRHYEFIQGLCSDLSKNGKLGAADDPKDAKSGPDLADADPSVDTDTQQTSLKAFDHGMFSDIVPSMDEMFENSADHRDEDAGLFRNLGIYTSRELLSTLDYLGANLAKVKQQNAALLSLERFFTAYARQIDDINASYVHQQISKHDAEHEAKHKLERELTARLLHNHEAKISAQALLVGTLEAEISSLKLERRKLLAQEKKEAPAKDKKSDIMRQSEISMDIDINGVDERAQIEYNIDFGPSRSSINDRRQSQMSQFSSSDEEAIGDPGNGSDRENGNGHENEQAGTLPLIEAQTPHFTHPLLKIPVLIPEELVDADARESDDKANSGTTAGHVISSTSTSTTSKAFRRPYKLGLFGRYFEKLNLVLFPYKTHGVAVGFFVVVAGFLYQNLKSD